MQSVAHALDVLQVYRFALYICALQFSVAEVIQDLQSAVCMDILTLDRILHAAWAGSKYVISDIRLLTNY